MQVNTNQAQKASKIFGQVLPVDQAALSSFTFGQDFAKILDSPTSDDQVSLDRILVRWRDRLLGFQFPPELAQDLGLDLSIELAGFNAVSCANCESYYTLAVDAGSAHPYTALKTALVSASRTLRKLEALDGIVLEAIGRHIPFQDIVLTFPDHLSIDEKTAWKVFHAFWNGPYSSAKPTKTDQADAMNKVAKHPDWTPAQQRGTLRACTDQAVSRAVKRRQKKAQAKAEAAGDPPPFDSAYTLNSFALRKFGSLANFHFWSSELPTKLNLHFHAVVGLVSVEELPSGGYSFKVHNPYLDLEQIRLAWARAIEDVLRAKAKKAKSPVPPFTFDRNIPLAPQLVIYLHFRRLPRDRAALLHALKYNGRRWLVDFGMCMAKASELEQKRYLDGLTSSAFFPNPVVDYLSHPPVVDLDLRVEGELDAETKADLKTLWHSPNRGHVFGWWRVLHQIAPIEVGDDKLTCEICGGSATQGVFVARKDALLAGCTWVLLGKKGTVHNLVRPPSWLSRLFPQEYSEAS